MADMKVDMKEIVIYGSEAAAHKRIKKCFQSNFILLKEHFIVSKGFFSFKTYI